MNGTEEFYGLLRKWLSSEEGYSAIKLFTRRNLTFLRNSGMPSTLEAQSRASGKGRNDSEQDGEETAHEFISFILSDIATQPEKRMDLAQTLFAGKYRLFLDLCWNRFLWDSKDKARCRRNNPLGYLYRRFRETVGRDQTFLSCRTDEGLLYYIVKEDIDSSHPPPTRNVLQAEGYLGWSGPPQLLALDRNSEVRVTAKWLKSTALFFWKQARINYPETCWFAVKEIVRYVGTMFPWLRNPQLMSADEKAEGGLALIETIEAISEDVTDCLDKREQIQSIALLAIQLVLTWTRVDCCVFVWRLRSSPLSYESISERLDLKSHNEAYSTLKKVEKSIKNFCGNWPGPPAEDLSGEVTEYFIHCLVDEAKKICSGP